MEIDNVLQNIDFTKKEHLIQIKNIINQELQQLIDNNYHIPNIHKRLLVSAQQQVMPFIYTILDFQSFHEFTDLKNAVNDIISCQKENKALPYPNMQHYEDLCYNTAFILSLLPFVLMENTSGDFTKASVHHSFRNEPGAVWPILNPCNKQGNII